MRAYHEFVVSRPGPAATGSGAMMLGCGLFDRTDRSSRKRREPLAFALFKCVGILPLRLAMKMCGPTRRHHCRSVRRAGSLVQTPFSSPTVTDSRRPVHNFAPPFPDDEASCCGCRGPGLVCGPVPAHCPRRFRRSHAWTGQAGRCCRLFSPAECRPGRPLSC